MSTNELDYDPKTKQYIKDKIYSYLYEPTQEQFRKRLKTIINQNSIIHQNNRECFMYRGEIHKIDQDLMPTRPANQLDPSLHVLMDEYLADLDRINTRELPYVMNYINQVLNSSNHLPDYFKLFPDSVHTVIQELINDCVCRDSSLSEIKAQQIRDSNQVPMELMKQRMVLNLIS